MEGKFVVQRGDKKFSMMALDQSHEHSINQVSERTVEQRAFTVSKGRKKSLNSPNERC